MYTKQSIDYNTFVGVIIEGKVCEKKHIDNSL